MIDLVEVGMMLYAVLFEHPDIREKTMENNINLPIQFIL